MRNVSLVLVFLVCLFSPVAGGVGAQGPLPTGYDPATRFAAEDLLPFRLSGTAGDASMAQIEELVPRAGPADVGDWSRLAFQSYRDGNWEIYLARGDGSSPARLTNHSASDVRPRLNRGATRVVFASNRGGNYDVYTINTDGSGLRQLTSHGPNDNYPAWSPDGNRIAFAYYKDENWEIYVMNADGSGQMRLTYGEGANISPAWSPDGRQIAWLRVKGNDGYVMVMNVDGSNQHAIVGPLKYAQNPAWSPDGKQLAFDYDADGDNWSELVVMRADGSGLHKVFDPGGALMDAWMGSWSPDGQFLLFSLVLYVVENNQLYYGAMGPVILSMTDGSAAALPGSGMDLSPDWQTTDILAPTSSMESLPAQSPAPISVRWSGVDLGGADLAAYDVQVRDGAAAWADWLIGMTETAALYPGIGGHTYAFRVRARDQAGNVEAWPADYDARTTVEALPPESQVNPLPAYARNVTVVTWRGVDPGDSGIKSYDVQVREAGAGDWVDWQTGTTLTSAVFSGISGRSYTFRSRAIDKAQNVEAWPTGAGDTVTTLYTWAITGTVRDNLGRPVSSATITSTPASLRDNTSSLDGTYALYVAEKASAYVAAWGKQRYGSLPPTRFDAAEDTHVDVILPPAFNVARNWGFESGALEPHWQPTGTIMPVVIARARHTGDNGLFLGQFSTSLSPSRNLSVDFSGGGSSRLVVDRHNVVHVVWASAGQLYYSWLADGVWSVPQQISNAADAVLLVDSTDVLHVFSRGVGPLTYLRRERNGVWSAPQPLPGSPNATWGMDAVVDHLGMVHAVWADFDRPRSSSVSIYYSCRGSDGAWSFPISPSDSGESHFNPRILADTQGNVHLVWWDRSTGREHVAYRERFPDGTWSHTQNISGDTDVVYGPPGVVIDGGDSLHVVFSRYYDPGMFYTRCDPGGAWTTPERFLTGHGSSLVELATDVRDTVHAVRWANGLWYARRVSGGTWSVPEHAFQSYTQALHTRLAVGPNGVVHVGWSASVSSGQRGVFYVRRGEDGQWSEVQQLSDMPTWTDSPPQLAVDGVGNPHIVWDNQTSEDTAHVFYVGPAPAAHTEDSTVQQPLVVPTSMASPTLSFVYRFGHSWSGDDSWFAVQVQDGVSATSLFSTTAATADWTHRWFDLSPWAGQAITLTFNVHQTAGGPTAWAYLDEITVGSGSYPDLWIDAPTQLAQPGAPVTYTLTYGNRGDGLARGGQISLTLPAGLSFVSADPPPSALGPPLVWDLGDLSTGDGPAMIIITGMIAPTAAPGSLLISTVNISSSTLEVEPDNNQTQMYVFVDGRRRYLPLIRR